MKARQTQVLVVGSGPGGATTAALLAEAGHSVLVVEEGPDLRVDSAPNYSAQEMSQKYRNHGLNTTFGKTGVTYIEGRCVGGASEINAALYHRPHAETLDAWRRDFRIDNFGMQALERYFVEVEEELSVSSRADGMAPNSRKLVDGADNCAEGWRAASGHWQSGRQPDHRIRVASHYCPSRLGNGRATGARHAASGQPVRDLRRRGRHTGG